MGRAEDMFTGGGAKPHANPTQKGKGIWGVAFSVAKKRFFSELVDCVHAPDGWVIAGLVA
jgi:hypothetical protein